MKQPIQIVFRNMHKSERIEDLVRQHVDKLESFCGDIMSCRVVVELPHKHHQHGHKYQVKVELTVPDRIIVASHEPGVREQYEDFQVALKDAFDSARRQLEDYIRIRRHDVKQHANAGIHRT
jgi:ribosome-associated translation inhibitor RaiA